MSAQLRFQVRRGQRAFLPDLLEGEFGFATDSRELFIGTEAANVQVGTSTEIDEKLAAAQAAAVAMTNAALVSAAADATAKASAVQAAATADAATKANYAQAAAEATAAADATAKVIAHAGATTAHSVSQVTNAVSTTFLTTNYYDKTAGDVRYMPAGMSPIVAAIIFGG